MRSIWVRTVPFVFALWLSGLSLAQAPAASAPHEPGRVVFVCEHGSVKSLIASLYFNQRAKQRGLPFRAIARGTTPDAAVPASVQEGLRAAGFDVSSYVPLRFKASDVDGAAFVVSFDQDIAATVAGRSQQLRWDNLPGVLADYSRGRDAILEHVDALIEQFAKTVQLEQSHD